MKAVAHREEHVRNGATLDAYDIGMNPTAVKETARAAELNGISGIEAFVRNPSNKTIVSLAAVLTRIRRAYICHPSGTVGFLEDLQDMVLHRPTKGGYQPGAFCALAPLRHAEFNAGGVLVALNFCYFGRLQMIFVARCREYIMWKADPRLVDHITQVRRDLYAAGHARLALEVVRRKYAVENWFPNAPRPEATAIIAGMDCSILGPLPNQAGVAADHGSFPLANSPRYSFKPVAAPSSPSC